MQEGLKTRETRMARCARSIVLYFYTGTKRPLKELAATEAGKASCVGIVWTGKAVDSDGLLYCLNSNAFNEAPSYFSLDPPQKDKMG